MTAISIIGIIVAVFGMSWLIYKDFNPIIAAFMAGLLMMFTSGLNVSTTWNTAMTSTGNMLAVLGPIIVFGGILGILYTNSGAAVSLGKLVLLPAKKIRSNSMKRMVTIALFLVLRALIGLSGIDAGALIVPMASLCLAVCAALNIPVKYVAALSMLGGTLGNVVPAAPTTINVMLETLIDGFSSSGGMAIRIILMILLIVGSAVILNHSMKKDEKRGEGYTEGPLGTPNLNDDVKRPNWFFSLLPIIAVFVTYNFIPGFEPWSSLLVGTVVAIIVFTPYLPKKEGESRFKTLLKNVDKGAVIIPLQFMMVMFASNVMSQTPGMSAISNWLAASTLPVAFALLILAIWLMGIGGSVSVVAIAPMCASIFIPMGLSPLACGIIIIWGATVLDTLPTNNAIFLTCQLVGSDMKHGYPPVFKTTVLLTLALAILAALTAVVGWI